MKAGLLLSSLLAGAQAVPARGPHVVHERRGPSSTRWVKRHALDAETRIPVRIALKQRNLDKGMDYLMAVSDPGSPSYGKHYTAEQVADLFAPDEASIRMVKDWLVSAGVPEAGIAVPPSRGWLHFDASVGQLEAALKTRYHVYDHALLKRGSGVGADEYSLPAHVSCVVDFITPGVALAPRDTDGEAKPDEAKADGEANADGQATAADEKPFSPVIGGDMVALSGELMTQLMSRPGGTDNCGSFITPACIMAMYNISDGRLADPRNRLGIFEIDQQKFSQQDLDQFNAVFAPRASTGAQLKVDSIGGGTAPTPIQQLAGKEANLDLQIAIPIIHPQGTEVYQTVIREDRPRGIFNSFLDAIDGSYCTFAAHNERGDSPVIDGISPNRQCGIFKPTTVISFSYGSAEAEYPPGYLKRQCDEFMKLGLRGTTVVFASGDSGVARRTGPRLGPERNVFTPNQPADCHYVTAVGATTLPASGKPGDPETATTDFSSGGGFSNPYTAPAYQKAAVDSDETTPANPGKGIFNRAGRGYPDLAALGQKGVVVIGGKPGLSGGTSMAAPIVAALFTCINDERLAAGKPPVGFVNPALYVNPDMFRDVTAGNQALGGPGKDSDPSACGNTGFSAVEGWNPVTGLGTPNYPAMLDVFMGI